MSNFICITCRDNMENLIPIENDLPETSFQFQEEHLQDISLVDPMKFFKKKGLHFLHLNCNSFPNKIDEIRELVLSIQPHIICFSETKLDKSITDGEIKIDNYSCVRKDRNRNGGGVACFIHKSIAYDVRSDFSNDFGNIFMHILLPKTKSILKGVIYDPHQICTLSKDYQIVYLIQIHLILKKLSFLVTLMLTFLIEKLNLSTKRDKDSQKRISITPLLFI